MVSRKILFTLNLLLIILGFVISVAAVSNKIDADLGWHLRFGKEASTGVFPFKDTYTYTHFGEKWVNHEWASDILFWKIYERAGYSFLVFLVGSLVWAFFVLFPKVFDVKISTFSLSISLMALFSVQHLLSVRPAMVASIFIGIIWYSIRHLENMRLYFLWPPIFLLWSWLHGSWVLGFVLLFIYIGIELLKWIDLPIFKKIFANERRWPKKIIFDCILFIFFSALVTLINPYGLRLWQEILSYVWISDYKSYIDEWLPIFSYPFFVWQVIIMIIGLSASYFAFRKKWIDLRDILVIIIFLYLGISYKRQMIFIVLSSSAIISKFEPEFAGWFKRKLGKASAALSFLLIGTLLLLLVYNYKKIYFYQNDIWHSGIARSSFPVNAISFLNIQDIQGKKVFNYLGWGGYLNWVLPTSTLIYFDGRGTSTWMHDKEETELAHYMKLVYFEPDGIKELEKNGVEYVILRKNKFGIAGDTVNKYIYNLEAKNVLSDKLAVSLISSPKWKMVYSDQMATVWQRATQQ